MNLLRCWLIDVLVVEEVLYAILHVRRELGDVNASHLKLVFSLKAYLKKFQLLLINGYQNFVSSRSILFEDDPSTLRKIVEKLLWRVLSVQLRSVLGPTSCRLSQQEHVVSVKTLNKRPILGPLFSFVFLHSIVFDRDNLSIVKEILL